MNIATRITMVSALASTGIAVGDFGPALWAMLTAYALFSLALLIPLQYLVWAVVIKPPGSPERKQP